MKPKEAQELSPGQRSSDAMISQPNSPGRTESHSDQNNNNEKEYLQYKKQIQIDKDRIIWYANYNPLLALSMIHTSLERDLIDIIRIEYGIKVKTSLDVLDQTGSYFAEGGEEFELDEIIPSKLLLAISEFSAMKSRFKRIFDDKVYYQII